VAVETVRPAGSGKTVEGIHVKHYDAGEPIDGLTLQNVDVSDVTNDAAGADGIKVQAQVENVRVVRSTVTDVRGVWSYGLVATPSSGEGGVPQDVVVVGNRFADITASEYAGVGVGIDAGGDTDADASAVLVRHNDLVATDYGVLNKDPDATLDARANWWGDASGPALSDDEDGVRVGGQVTYDPFLRKPQPETGGPGETTAYAHDLTIPVDSDAYAVGFPADVSGTAAAVFGGDFQGNLWTYDAESGEWNRVEPDAELSALDVVVVDPKEGAAKYDDVEQLRVDFAYAAPSGDTPARPPETDLSAGWNLVAAPQFDAGEEAFAASTADPQRVLDVYAQPGSQPYAGATVQTPTGDASDDLVTPFSGYWVYVTEDGTLAGAVPQQTPASDESALLKEA
jgi:hypothetical protein